MTETENYKSLYEGILKLYSDIKNEISKEQIKHHIDIDIEKLRKIDTNLIIDYIRELIEILVNQRVEKLAKINTDKHTASTTINEGEKYEELITKLESNIREHIKVI
jgi:hypothetical protein